jgi:DNA polymerase III epsilon subunit-like protein
MCFDVETGDQGENGDIVQLAYQVYDEKYNLIRSSNRYIKDRLVMNRFRDIHHIDIEKLQKEGLPFVDVMTEFLTDLNTCKSVVGHNVQSDINHLKDNMERHGVQTSRGKDLFEDRIIHCTMKLGTPVCLLKNKIGRIKSPRLGELYQHLYGKPMKNAHNALYDVKYTWECYRKLVPLVEPKAEPSAEPMTEPKAEPQTQPKAEPMTDKKIRIKSKIKKSPMSIEDFLE